MSLEVERKFLIHQLPPEILRIKPEYIKQGYLTRSEEREVRIRKKGHRHFLTVKDRGNMSRREYETPLKKNSFLTLWPATRGARIEKERRLVPYGELFLEIDIYQGALSGLITGEVEFPHISRAADFTVPDYFKEELTYNEKLKNSNLASMNTYELNALLPLRTPGEYPLIGVLPFIREGDDFQIMIITTRTNGSWIFPKGQPMPGKTGEEVALIEAMEEAGIKGILTGIPLVVPYMKSSGMTGMILYPMEITKISKVWHEENERARKLVSITEASRKITQPGLISALECLELLRK